MATAPRPRRGPFSRLQPSARRFASKILLLHHAEGIPVVAGDALRALFSIGKYVPQDVRILGFDDSAESRVSRPALSTIHIHTEIMAFSALHLLMSRMREPSLDFRVVHTETNLICRESTEIDNT
jgi:hypothetical protein